MGGVALALFCSSVPNSSVFATCYTHACVRGNLYIWTVIRLVLAFFLVTKMQLQLISLGCKRNIFVFGCKRNSFDIAVHLSHRRMGVIVHVGAFVVQLLRFS